MHAIRQGFRNIRQRTALATHLCCVAGRYCDHCHTSFFRFVRQDRQKQSPSGVMCRLCQSAAGDALNVQFLVSNGTIPCYQCPRCFVMKIAALVCDVLILLSQCINSLCATLATFFAVAPLCVVPGVVPPALFAGAAAGRYLRHLRS